MSRMIDRLTAWQRPGESAFGYDATDAKGRRRAPDGKTHAEDRVLPMAGRAKVQSAARDLIRNFTIAGWMIRRHLDYVAPHSFHSRSGDEGFDAECEAALAEWSTAGEFDAAGRFPLCEFVRLTEACATIDGDCGRLKLDDGKSQAIESDRIRNPEKDSKGWVNGIRKGPGGTVAAYAIWGHDDTGTRYKFERTIPADNLFLHGHFQRFNQYRGISPLVPGLNSLQDVYEGIGYGIAKLKVEQLFALALYRDATEAAGEIDDTAAVDEDGSEVNKGGYQVDFASNGGQIVLDLDPGDRAEFLKSDSPGANSREFLHAVVMVAMKALDLPYSFYDEQHTNFFGSRAAWLHYERSCTPKRERVRRLLDDWTAWRMRIAMRRGFRIPAALTTVRPWWEWVPEGMPWWDPAKEIKGDTDAIGGGFTTPQRVVRQRGGGDVFRNILDIKRTIDFARANGVVLSYDAEQVSKLKPAAPPPVEAKPETDTETEDKPEGEKEPNDA